MTKIHLAFLDKEGASYCSWNDKHPHTITTDISEVTCRACLKSIVPERTLEELRELATVIYNSSSKERV